MQAILGRSGNGSIHRPAVVWAASGARQCQTDPMSPGINKRAAQCNTGWLAGQQPRGLGLADTANLGCGMQGNRNPCCCRRPPTHTAHSHHPPTCTPREARETLPLPISWGTTRATVLIGMAKPTPTDKPAKHKMTRRVKLHAGLTMQLSACIQPRLSAPS